MSDIVERLRACCERANKVNCPDAYGRHAEPHDMCERCHAAAEIERLRAGERAADAEIERLSALALERTEEVLRLRAAEAQRDALVAAAEPFVSERLKWPDYVPDEDYLFIASPDDIEPILDEYASLCGSKSAGVSFSNDTVTIGNLRALSAAVAGAKTEGE